MGKRRDPADQAAFDERTRMIDEYIARLTAKIEAKKAAQQQA
jgi:hypothetical protein